VFSFKIDNLQGIIFTRISGTPTTITMIDHMQNVMNDPDFDTKYNSIIVLDENTRIKAAPKDKIETLRCVLDGYARQREGCKWAVVAPDRKQEMFLKLNLELINPAVFNLRIFQNEDDALSWIKLQ
jgi:hypothetical protein